MTCLLLPGIPRMNTGKNPFGSGASEALDVAMLATAANRLSDRWRLLASRLERYAPAAAEAYEQAAQDLDAEIGRHAVRMDALHALRDELVAALRPR